MLEFPLIETPTVLDVGVLAFCLGCAVGVVFTLQRWKACDRSLTQVAYRIGSVDRRVDKLWKDCCGYQTIKSEIHDPTAALRKLCRRHEDCLQAIYAINNELTRAQSTRIPDATRDRLGAYSLAINQVHRRFKNITSILDDETADLKAEAFHRQSANQT